MNSSGSNANNMNTNMNANISDNIENIASSARGIMEGKKVLIIGLRNKWSIAWGITKRLYDEGADLAFTYQGDRDESSIRNLVNSLCDEARHNTRQQTRQQTEQHARQQTEQHARQQSQQNEHFPMIKCDLFAGDEEIDAAFAAIGAQWGRLDGVVHAIAHARTEDLQNDFILTSREGFAHALDASVYSLIYVSRKASELMTKSSGGSGGNDGGSGSGSGGNDGGSGGGGAILTLTYMGSERVFPGYNVMGVAKAALEATVRYLAYNLGSKGIRINAISAGPIKTLSAKAVKNFSSMLTNVDEKAPLQRGVNAEEVGGSALYLLSDLSSAVTGEIHYVDCGFNIMGT